MRRTNECLIRDRTESAFELSERPTAFIRHEGVGRCLFRSQDEDNLKFSLGFAQRNIKVQVAVCAWQESVNFQTELRSIKQKAMIVYHVPPQQNPRFIGADNLYQLKRPIVNAQKNSKHRQSVYDASQSSNRHGSHLRKT